MTAFHPARTSEYTSKFGTPVQKAAFAVGAVHLAFGVAGIAVARTFNSARSYLIGGGVVYLVLFIYGLVIEQTVRPTSFPSTMPTTGCTWGSRSP